MKRARIKPRNRFEKLFARAVVRANHARNLGAPEYPDGGFAFTAALILADLYGPGVRGADPVWALETCLRIPPATQRALRRAHNE